jgi:hypothetical protein
LLRAPGEGGDAAVGEGNAHPVGEGPALGHGVDVLVENGLKGGAAEDGGADVGQGVLDGEGFGDGLEAAGAEVGGPANGIDIGGPSTIVRGEDAVVLADHA